MYSIKSLGHNWATRIKKVSFLHNNRGKRFLWSRFQSLSLEEFKLAGHRDFTVLRAVLHNFWRSQDTARKSKDIFNSATNKTWLVTSIWPNYDCVHVVVDWAARFQSPVKFIYLVCCFQFYWTQGLYIEERNSCSVSILLRHQVLNSIRDVTTHSHVLFTQSVISSWCFCSWNFLFLTISVLEQNNLLIITEP